jgi:hypothetical protein
MELNFVTDNLPVKIIGGKDPLKYRRNPMIGGRAPEEVKSRSNPEKLYS